MPDKNVANQSAGRAPDDAPAPRTWKTIAGWAGGILGVLALAVVLASVAIVAFEIPLGLGFLSNRIESAASRALGREVSIDGAVRLVAGAWPSVEAEGITIGNPPGWDSKDFVRIEKIRFGIGLFALLAKDIRISHLIVDGLEISLASRSDGAQNWDFAELDSTGSGPAASGAKERAAAIRLAELKNLVVRHADVLYDGPDLPQAVAFRIDEMNATAAEGEDIKATMGATYNEQPLALSMQGGPLADLLAKAAPWPLAFSADIGPATLSVQGGLDLASADRFARFKVSVSGDRLADLGALVGVGLASVGPYRLNVDSQVSKSSIRLSALEGSIGETVFSGSFDLNTATGEPQAAGQLTFATLDLGLLASVSGRNGTDETGRPIDTEGRKDRLSLDALKAANLDLNLKLAVTRVLGAPLDIRGGAFNLTLKDGRLTAPAEVTVAGSRLKGSLDVNTGQEVPRLKLMLATEDADVGRMVQTLEAVGELEARLGHFRLTAGARGADLDSLIKDLDLDLRLRESRFAYGGGEDKAPVNLLLRSARVGLNPEKGLTVAAGGEWLGEKFTLNLAAKEFTGLGSTPPWPFDLSFSGAGADLDIVGKWSQPSMSKGPSLNLRLTGQRIGDLAPWVGTAPTADEAYEIRGSVARFKDAWRLDIEKALIGDFALSGHMGVKGLGSDNLHYTIALNSGDLDMVAFRNLFKKQDSEARSAPANGDKQFTIDMPILPHQVELKDADIEIAVDRLRMKPADLTDLLLIAQVRNGRVQSAPFSATMAGADFAGTFSLDLTGELPKAMLDFTTKQIDIGDFLSTLGIVDTMEAAAESIEVDVVARGKTLLDMVEKGELTVKVTDGRWTLRDANTRASADIGILSASYQAMPGEPRMLTLAGRIGEIPIDVRLEIDPILSAPARDHLPFSLEAAASGARVEFDGHLDLPLSNRNLQLKMALEAEKLDSLNPLFDVSLPPWGPYRMEGIFRVGSRGYSLENLFLQIGGSKLSGSMNLLTAAEQPLLTTDLIAETVQLDDFELGDWSPMKPPLQSPETPHITGAAAEPTDWSQERIKSLLDPTLVNLLDTDFKLQVKEVLSGEDSLGSGRLEMAQQDGRFAIKTLELNIPGGDINISAEFDIAEQETAARFKADIDRLDYGVIARRASADSDAKGFVSLDLALDSRAEGFEQLMANANGHFDFALEPEDLTAGAIDLWAVNLVAAVLPILNPTRDSKINCAVGRFHLKDGIMTENEILVDTSRIQVRGRGKIDFKTQTLDIRLTPRPKRPQFFSMATPIQISGNFEDFGVGVAPGGLIGTAIRVATSYITVPIQWLIFNKLPTDGKAACAKAMGIEPDKGK